MKPAAHTHDRINLLLLPLLGLSTVLGLLGVMDTYHVSVAFMAYTLVDMVWVFVQPDCVPSLPNVILFHHAVTALLLCFPLKYPELGMFTCLDGVTELNTWALIARRQYKQYRRFWSWAYWGSFALFRMVLYPALLPVFYKRMQGFAWWEQMAVCGSQLVLIGFNVVLLALQCINWRKRCLGKLQRNAAATAPGSAGAITSCGPSSTSVDMATGDGKPAHAVKLATVTLRARG